MFKRILDWFTTRQMNDIEKYISSRDPKSAADVEHLIQEFNRKRNLQWY